MAPLIRTVLDLLATRGSLQRGDVRADHCRRPFDRPQGGLLATYLRIRRLEMSIVRLSPYLNFDARPSRRSRSTTVRLERKRKRCPGVATYPVWTSLQNTTRESFTPSCTIGDNVLTVSDTQPGVPVEREGNVQVSLDFDDHAHECDLPDPRGERPDPCRSRTPSGDPDSGCSPTHTACTGCPTAAPGGADPYRWSRHSAWLTSAPR
jgi:hypothetical protein